MTAATSALSTKPKPPPKPATDRTQDGQWIYQTGELTINGFHIFWDLPALFDRINEQVDQCIPEGDFLVETLDTFAHMRPVEPIANPRAGSEAPGQSAQVQKLLYWQFECDTWVRGPNLGNVDSLCNKDNDVALPQAGHWGCGGYGNSMRHSLATSDYIHTFQEAKKENKIYHLEPGHLYEDHPQHKLWSFLRICLSLSPGFLPIARVAYAFSSLFRRMSELLYQGHYRYVHELDKFWSYSRHMVSSQARLTI